MVSVIEKVNDQNHMEMKPPQISLPASIPSTSSVVFSMDQMSPGGSAIVAAASQAIVATQQVGNNVCVCVILIFTVIYFFRYFIKSVFRFCSQ